MKAIKRQTVGCVILLAAWPCLAAESASPAPYLGQEPPGLVPRSFAPGTISLTNRGEGNLCFTRDWRECYFDTSSSNRANQIMVTHYENGRWTTPVPSPFSDDKSYGPTLADNDQTLYFIRSRYTVWKVHRPSAASGIEGWSRPELVPAPVNFNPDTNSNVSCKISSLGNMWICSWRPGGLGQCDLWRLGYASGQFTEPTNQLALNSPGSDCTAVPGPGEQYVVLRSNRPGGVGNGDLYVAFADSQGGWTAPTNLGTSINTTNWEDSPTLSPDGKYLFFSRTESGDKNIFWVSTEAIQSLRAGSSPPPKTK